MRKDEAVLLVEDFVMGRKYIAGELRANGYTVLEAGAVHEAEDAIDQSTQQHEADQVPLKIGAVILDGRFPYGDERDETESRDGHRPARAVVSRIKARRLGKVTFIGFSSEPMKYQAIGLSDDDEGSFIDVGKFKGGPREILEALETAD